MSAWLACLFGGMVFGAAGYIGRLEWEKRAAPVAPPAPPPHRDGKTKKAAPR